MKLSSALSKLRTSGYKVDNNATSAHGDFVATKDSKQIKFSLHVDGVTLDEIRYSDGTLKLKKVHNLTQALRKLGDLVCPVRNTEVVGSGRTTSKSLIRRFVEEKELSPSQLTSLNIKTFRQLIEQFEETFKTVYRSSKRYSYRKERMQRQLNSAKFELWEALVKNFMSQPSALPLRLVEISTKVPGFEDAKDAWGSRIRTEVRTKAPVFAKTSDEARMIVQSIMGDLATVGNAEIVAITSQEEAMEIYRTNLETSGRKEEERSFVEAQNRLREAEKSLEIAKMNVELGKKKIELITFIENFSTVATISSQSGDIAGISLD